MSGVYDGLELATLKDIFPPETRESATPMRHVSKDAPPFFVTWGDNDMPSLIVSAKAFTSRLERVGAKVSSLEVKDRNHLSIVAKIGSENDELTDAVVKYVKESSASK